jgi:hypothetical protein
MKALPVSAAYPPRVRLPAPQPISRALDCRPRSPSQLPLPKELTLDCTGDF